MKRGEGKKSQMGFLKECIILSWLLWWWWCGDEDEDVNVLSPVTIYYKKCRYNFKVFFKKFDCFRKGYFCKKNKNKFTKNFATLTTAMATCLVKIQVNWKKYLSDLYH